MNKKELVDAVAEETGASKADVAKVLNATIDAIQTAVGAGDKVTLTGFGSFEQVHKPAREARNPSTDEPVQVSESWVPKFRPGMGFKDLVNAGGRKLPKAA